MGKGSLTAKHPNGLQGGQAMRSQAAGQGIWARHSVASVDPRRDNSGRGRWHGHCGNVTGVNDGAAALSDRATRRRPSSASSLGAFVTSAAVRRLLGRTSVSAGELDPDRAERGVRFAIARSDPRTRAGRGEGERKRRRDCARPPARDERCTARRLIPPRAAALRRPERLATPYVGVGQGQAALFERRNAGPLDDQAVRRRRVPPWSFVCSGAPASR